MKRKLEDKDQEDGFDMAEALSNLDGAITGFVNVLPHADMFVRACEDMKRQVDEIVALRDEYEHGLDTELMSKYSEARFKLQHQF